jgi:hypothetical protein
MDWIERLLGFSPDNGDGSLELLLTALAATLLVAAVLLRKWSSKWLSASRRQRR